MMFRGSLAVGTGAANTCNDRNVMWLCQGNRQL